MPKSQMIIPEQVRQSGRVEFTPIPINQYEKTIREELACYSEKDLVKIFRDMVIIRAFESMLNEVKLRGNYQGIKYSHNGPAHLSLGQEGAVVGQAFLLGPEDHIYGSHRSHGEILAKGLSAIEKLPEGSLLPIMENYFDGDCLRVVEKDATGSVKELATDYLLYGALAEIFGRMGGFNRGMGGSMHAFFPPFGIYPNNAIVGGSADIGVGAALYKNVNRKAGIVVANIGDAAAGCGPVWEALCFSTMAQFKELWDGPYRRGLPLIVNFVNNFYGMGGQPVGETMGFEVLARLGASLNPQQMHAERVDGYHPLAVIDAMARKKKIIEQGDGPVLLDTLTYRFSGHSPSDASSYRERSEIEAWKRVDPLVTYVEQLVEAGVCSPQQLDAIREQVDAAILKAYKKAIDLEISPRADLKMVDCLLDRTMYSGETIEALAEGTPEVLIPKHDNARVQQLARRSRSAFDKNGKRLPKIRCIGIRDALFEAILDRFYVDPTLIAYGEENRDWGEGLCRLPGPHRVSALSPTV